MEEKEIKWWEVEDKPEIKNRIENRGEKEIQGMLKSHGLFKGNGVNKNRNYSLAKALIFEGQFIDSDIYDKQIKWICDYLGV